MNKLITKDNIKIENMIYEIRGKQVMLDSDLAKLYQCKNGTKTINLAVKRNIERFPNNFYFQLTEKEYYSRFQFETLNNIKKGQNLKYLPYVFTEQGVAMLATVIRTEQAINVSINIMNTFVAMRHFINENKEVLTSIVNVRNDIDNINNKLIEHDNKFNEIFDKLNKKEINKEYIFFKGQIYDSYEVIIDIIKIAEKKHNNNR